MRMKNLLEKIGYSLLSTASTYIIYSIGLLIPYYILCNRI